jgi:hypothetical protein
MIEADNEAVFPGLLAIFIGDELFVMKNEE